MLSEPGLTRPTRIHPTTTAAYPPPNLSEPLPCPRCNSNITKFCYYNNYNLAQPRYFCKSCRRYWTHGGTLRDVPVGGGTRRRRTSSKRHRSFSATATTASSSSTTSSSVVSTTQRSEENAKNESKSSDVISGFGSFASLLGGQNNEGAFLALGSGNGEVDYGSGFGFGYGFEEMSVGYSDGGGGEIPVGNGGGDTWQIGEIDGKNGDSLIWPGLEISMQPNNV